MEYNPPTMKERQRQAWIHRALHFAQVIEDWRYAEYSKLPDSSLAPTEWEEGHQLILATEKWMWRSYKYARHEVWMSLVAEALMWPVPNGVSAKQHGSRINAIKVIRRATNLHLVSAKWIVDMLTKSLDPQSVVTIVPLSGDEHRCYQILESLEELYMIW